MTKVLFLLFLPVFLFGQTYSGNIIDQSTKEVIPFVNIGILNKTIGTVSNLNGKFSITFDKTIKNTDTIRISMIGYATRDFLIKDFTKKMTDASAITLKSINYELSEITVIPRDYVEKKVGNFKRRENMTVGFENHLMGHEMGILMKIKNKPTFVEKVYLNIISCTYDTIFYRMNIYEYDKKTRKPIKNVLQQPIYLNYTKEEIAETIEVDLSHLNIYVEDDFVVTLELVKDLGEGDIYFSANFKSKGLYRTTSQSSWIKAPMNIGPGIWAIIKQEK